MRRTPWFFLFLFLACSAGSASLCWAEGEKPLLLREPTVSKTEISPIKKPKGNSGVFSSRRSTNTAPTAVSRKPNSPLNSLLKSPTSLDR